MRLRRNSTALVLALLVGLAGVVTGGRALAQTAPDGGAPTAKVAAPVSACKGLEEAACQAKAGSTPGTCQWMPAITLKNGKPRRAFCRTVPACFGLKDAACTADKACLWVPAGKTAAGKNHPAYCRKKPKA